MTSMANDRKKTGAELLRLFETLELELEELEAAYLLQFDSDSGLEEKLKASRRGLVALKKINRIRPRIQDSLAKLEK